MLLLRAALLGALLGAACGAPVPTAGLGTPETPHALDDAAAAQEAPRGWELEFHRGLDKAFSAPEEDHHGGWVVDEHQHVQEGEHTDLHIVPHELPEGHGADDHGSVDDHGHENPHGQAGAHALEVPADPHHHDAGHGHGGDAHGAAHGDAHGDPHGDGGHGHHGPDPWDDETAVVFILFLIVLSLVFEKGRHMLEHNVREAEKIVVNALFGEVTVLGFIALVTFFMIKSGMFEALSRRIFHSEGHMLHLFEDVHFGLFFAMMLYLVLVIWVLWVLSRAVTRWEELELEAREFQRENGVATRSNRPPTFQSGAPVKPPSLPMPKVEYLEWRYNGGGRIPVGFDGVSQDDPTAGDAAELGEVLTTRRPASDELHAYMLVRARFIATCRVGGVEGRKRSDVDWSFSMSKYLENCAAETVRGIVTVHEVTWIAIAFFMVLAYALFRMVGTVGSCFLLAGFGGLLTAGMVWLLLVTRHIYRMTAPPLACNVRQVATGHRAAEPPYQALHASKGASKHEQLFPFGAAGPAFLSHFLRTTLLMTAIYAVGLFVVFAQLMLHHHLLILLPIAVVLSLVPLAILKPVLPRLVVITSVGQLKRMKTIDETLREVKLARSLKTMKVLAALQSQLKRLKKLSGGGVRKDRKRRTVDKKQEADLRDAFQLFDTDRSGKIDARELRKLLHALGQHVSEAEAQRLLSEMDVGGDGEVSFEEFYDVMADDDEAPVQDPVALAKEMFHMLDKDNSGEISLKEFRDLLQSLPMDLSQEDIDAMLHEIFGEDEDAAIDEHEFLKFLSNNL